MPSMPLHMVPRAFCNCIFFPRKGAMLRAKAAMTVFAWPVVLHLLFITARKYDGLLQNFFLRLLLYVGSSIVLVRLPAAPDVKSMKLALTRGIAPMIEPFVAESWIAGKLAGFFSGRTPSKSLASPRTQHGPSSYTLHFTGRNPPTPSERPLKACCWDSRVPSWPSRR